VWIIVIANRERVAAFRRKSADSMGRSGLLPMDDKPGILNTKCVHRCFFTTKLTIFEADLGLANAQRAALHD
jgi:hypothetical protein